MPIVLESTRWVQGNRILSFLRPTNAPGARRRVGESTRFHRFAWGSVGLGAPISGPWLARATNGIHRF
ncbi:hypothetical protein CC2G_012913 [Coprinopsis cinerea AmutBmut pab1-1]|nr:hypothetical protein CC2G_012913 [Coprinopsis cinerea AmutBmut pab1-1]